MSHSSQTNTHSHVVQISTDSSSSTAIYIEPDNDDKIHPNESINSKKKKELKFQPSSAYNYFNQHRIGTRDHDTTTNNKSSIFNLFGNDDSITNNINHLNYNILETLTSPSKYYNYLYQNTQYNQYNQSYHNNSDTSSTISKKKRKKRRKASNNLQNFIYIIKYLNNILCIMIKLIIDSIVLLFNKLTKYRKDIKEAPIETKEKYFFGISTLISTILFYLLFLCLDFIIKYCDLFPVILHKYSFSISYILSYLTSVIWQHFFNQYFVFIYINDNLRSGSESGAVVSLLRTYSVYGTTLLITGLCGGLLQIYLAIPDQFILFLTAPISGIINYYLLRYCHHVPRTKPTNGHSGASKLKPNSKSKPRHIYSIKYHQIQTNNNKTSSIANDDIIIV